MILSNLNENTGVIVRASRRWAEVLRGGFQIVRGTATNNLIDDITVGDLATLTKMSGELKVTALADRKNFLTRQYGKKVKRIAANLDRLYIVTAPGTLLNIDFIDRALCAAGEQAIPTSLIFNKIDLAKGKEDSVLNYYEKIGIDIIRTSAKKGDVSTLTGILESRNEELVSFAGVSGVGKSSLLNELIPEAERETGSVSARTGQGKQTTSQSMAYVYESVNKKMLIIDLPGIQNYGITHLEKQDIVRGMPDILEFAIHCEYSDCAHRAEEQCGVKAALKSGKLAEFRYNSYCAMLDEIESVREY